MMIAPEGVNPGLGTCPGRPDFAGRACGLRPPPTFDVFVPGRSAPQGSKAYKGHRMNASGRSVPLLLEVSRAVGPWRDMVAQVSALHWRPRLPMGGPLEVWTDFVLRRPIGTPKGITPPAIKRNGDGDKLTRAVWDALTGAVIEDDCLITRWSGGKRIAEIGESPGCRIRIWRMTE